MPLGGYRGAEISITPMLLHLVL